MKNIVAIAITALVAMVMHSQKYMNSVIIHNTPLASSLGPSQLFNVAR